MEFGEAIGGPTNEPSVSSSLEHLVVGSQGVITKRINLAVLDGKEFLSQTLQRAAMVSASGNGSVATPRTAAKP